MTWWKKLTNKLARKKDRAYESPQDAALNAFLETYQCKGDGRCCELGVYCGDCINAYLRKKCESAEENRNHSVENGV